MRKELFKVLLSVLILTAAGGCSGREGNSSALEIHGDTTEGIEMQNIVRRAGQHEVISEDWGTLTGVAKKVRHRPAGPRRSLGLEKKP